MVRKVGIAARPSSSPITPSAVSLDHYVGDPVRQRLGWHNESAKLAYRRYYGAETSARFVSLLQLLL